MTTTNLAPTQFELTGESKVGIHGITVYRIRATKDIPKLGVKAGDVGGWVQSLHLENGSARVGDSAWVSGNAQVSGDARVYGAAWVFGNAQVYGDAWVYGDAQVYGDAWVSGNAQVERTWHLITVGPIGSENVTATLFRTKDGKHALIVGCWTGTLGTLMAEVKRRRESWAGDEAQHEAWTAQYKALKALGKATVGRWAE